MPLISFGWLFDRSVRRLPRVAVLASSITLLSAIAIVGSIRNTPGFWQHPAGLFQQAFLSENNPVVDAVSEMGGSLVTVIHTIRLVPSVRPFDYGTSYAYAVSTIIPNVGWRVHPAITHGMLSDWLIATVDPTAARVGGGLGYSFVAEAFANFGWYGTAPVLACIGYLLMRLFQWGTDTTDPARLALTATFLATFLYFARGESATVLRSFVWYSLLPYLAVTMIARHKSVRRGVLRARAPEHLGLSLRVRQAGHGDK
jgi:hypothetical protein